LPENASRWAENAPEGVWWLGSAQTRWGSLSAPPDPLGAMREAYF